LIHIALSVIALFSFTACKKAPSADDSLYRAFQARDKPYFMQVAHECDFLLRQYPSGSPGLEPHPRAPGLFSLSELASVLPASLHDIRSPEAMAGRRRSACTFPSSSSS